MNGERRSADVVFFDVEQVDEITVETSTSS